WRRSRRSPAICTARPRTEREWAPRWWRVRGPRLPRRRAMGEVSVKLTVNGQPRAATVEPRVTLADFLREQLQLTGTHLGCEHGVCGACAVLVDRPAGRSGLIVAVQADCHGVTAIQGMSSHHGQRPGVLFAGHNGL